MDGQEEESFSAIAKVTRNRGPESVGRMKLAQDEALDQSGIAVAHRLLSSRLSLWALEAFAAATGHGFAQTPLDSFCGFPDKRASRAGGLIWPGYNIVTPHMGARRSR